MAYNIKDDGTVRIDEYSLVEFLCTIQEMVIRGYRISVQNDHYPQGFSGLYFCTMVKEVQEQPQVESNENVETDVQEKPAARRGRKPKSSD